LYQLPAPAGESPGGAWETFRPELANVFPLLPENRQAGMLWHEWERIAHPNLLPHLLEIYRRPISPEADPFQQPMSLRASAVRRIGDLDPSMGRRIVVEEVRKPELSVDVEALLHLPDEQLAELDDVLIERFALPPENPAVFIAARLIERYASPEIFEAVREIYGDDDNRDCITQQSILSYFLRVESEWAVKRVRQAMRYRPKPTTHCRDRLLEVLSRDRARPDLEPIAAELLNDPEPVVAAQAASWLGQHGSESARESLWERLSRWSEEWRGRKEELSQFRSNADYRANPETLEAALVEALRDPGHPYGLEERLARIRLFCVTNRCLDSTAPRE
jgi:hypothetical protein